MDELQLLEERLAQEKKQQELRFQIQQKQQLVQQQQKSAEAYAMMAQSGHLPSGFELHHMMTSAEDFDELMPDPLQYMSIMGAPPPPPVAENERPPGVDEEPVLPPGIDAEEANALEPISDALHPRKGALPKDFQDALSIIFDKGADTSQDETVESSGESTSQTVSGDNTVTTYVHMDSSTIEPETVIVPPPVLTAAEIDQQSQYIMWGSMTDKPLVFNEVPIPPTLQISSISARSAAMMLPENIPTPPIQILDAAGNITQIPGTATNEDFNMILDTADKNDQEEAAIKAKRMQELDDLAMLGITVDDMAAQCL